MSQDTDGMFGDQIALTLFLGVLCFGMLSWRSGIFITDNETLVRTLQAMSEGRLWVEEVEGEDFFDAPGAEVRDGRVYGRNYGQLVLSLPALFVLQLLDAIADIRIALVGIMHLVLLAFLIQLGTFTNRGREVALVASVLVLLSFLWNLTIATQLHEPRLALLALQLTALVAAGALAVVFYRLLDYQFERRIAILGGAASVVVLPVGFWATIPKRHIFSVLAVALILYCFAVSREPDSRRSLPVVGEMPVYRAGAYATVGLLTWIHAAEGLFLFLVLVVVDLATAPRNDRRTLAFVGCIFGLAVLPTVVTNLLVTGSPAEPPRTLGGGSFAGPAQQPEAEAETSTGLLDTLSELPLVGYGFWLASTIASITGDSLRAATEGNRLVGTFIRSADANITGGQLEYAGANLSVLETAPVLAALVAGLVAWLSRVREAPRRVLAETDPTAILAVGFILSFLAIYVSRLPLYVQITQRYILPIFLLGLYLLVRWGRLRDIVDRGRPELLWSYAAGVLVGTQLLVAYVVHRNLALAEATQVNATLSLLVAVLVLVTTLGSVRWRQFDRPAAIAIGLACAAGTMFLLMAGVQYFSITGEYILPAIERLSAFL